MNTTFNTVVSIFNLLPTFNEMNSIHTTYSSSKRIQSLMLEKILVSFLGRVLPLVGNEISYTDTVCYEPKIKGFRLTNEKDASENLIESGEDTLRRDLSFGDVDNMDLFKKFVATFQQSGWDIYYTDTNLRDYYFACEYEPSGELKEDLSSTDIEEIVLNRTDEEFIDDICLSDFFEKEILCDEHGHICDFLRMSFSADATFLRYMFLIKNDNLPKFLKFGSIPTVLTEEDAFYFDLISKCRICLRYGFSLCDSDCIESPELQSSYWCHIFYDADMRSYNGEELADMVSVMPHLFLVPYIMDYCILFLDNKYHFGGEGGIVEHG